MKSNRDAPFPPEFGYTIGIVLALSGQFPTAILAAILWLVLRALRKNAGTDLLLVASLTLTTSLLALLGVMIAGVPLSSVWLTMAEMVGCDIIALMLLFTGLPVCAWLLLFHSAYIVCLRVSELQHVDFNDFRRNGTIGTVAVQVAIIWALVFYLRRRNAPQMPPASAESYKTGGAAFRGTR